MTSVMIMNDIKIKTVSVQDAAELLKIYEPYVLNTAITFEYDVPSVGEFASRITNTLEKYPYIKAVSDEKILGYAYVSPFKERAAYDRAVESSIYIAEDAHRRGIGSLLYNSLEDILKAQGILNLNACIAYPDTEDEYLTADSVKFHKALGYEICAHFHKCGYKFGKWYDMVWMEKFIGEHTAEPKPIIPFPMLNIK